MVDYIDPALTSSYKHTKITTKFRETIIEKHLKTSYRIPITEDIKKKLIRAGRRDGDMEQASPKTTV